MCTQYPVKSESTQRKTPTSCRLLRETGESTGWAVGKARVVLAKTPMSPAILENCILIWNGVKSKNRYLEL